MAQLPLPARPVYAHYHAANSGLPTDLIYKVHADHNGYLWLATDRGLLRYNGLTFTLVNTGTSEDFISTFITANKQLWLFAYSGHTAGIDLNTHKVINTDSLYGLQRLPSEGSIFLLGNQQKHMLSLYKGKRVVSVNLDSRKSWSKKQTSEDKAQELLRQYHFTPNQQQQLMPELTNIFKHNCYGLSIKDSFITIGNKIFQTVPGKVAKPYFNGADYGIKTYIMGFARRNEDLYLGGLHDIGLRCIKGYFSRPREQQVVEPLLQGEAITSIEQDYLRNVWVSTHGNGLFLFPYSERNTLYYNKSSGLYSDKVSSINHFSNGITTLGYDDAVLDFYTASNPLPERYVLPVKNDIRDVRYVERLASSWMVFTPNEAFYSRSWNDGLPVAFHQAVVNGRGIDPGYKNGRQYYNTLYYISGNAMVAMDTAGQISAKNTSGVTIPKKLCLLPLSDTAFYVGTVRGCYRNTTALPYLQNVLVSAVDTVGDQLLWATNAGVYTLPQKNAGNGRQLRKIISVPCTALKHDSLFTYLRSGDDLIIVENNTMKPVARFSCRDYIIPFRLGRFYIHGNYLVLAGNQGVFYIPCQNLLQLCPSQKPKIHVLCSLNSNAPADSTFSCVYRANLIALFGLDIMDYKNEQQKISCRIFRNNELLYSQTDLDKNGTVSLHPASPGCYRVEYHVQSASCATERLMSYTLLIMPLWYQQWWCMPVLILLIAAVFSYVLYRLYMRKFRDDRNKLQQKLYLHELEAQSLLGQLKPHFIFNILTPLQGFLMTGEKIKGLSYLDSFSQLMRGMLNAIRERYAPLATELDFIQHYLQIQQERFDNSFTYSITVAPSLAGIGCIIPTLLLQPLVENAIEHGIVKTHKGGIINITVEDNGGTITIKVKDNGKGLPEDFKIKQNHALMIITERMHLLKKIKGTGEFYIFNNEGNEPGVTSVLILAKNN
ncbi:MAG: histidine kinase [Taibaiella sp.]|jgi:hypothetical protein